MLIINDRILPEYVVDKNMNLVSFNSLKYRTKEKVFIHSQHISVLKGRPFLKEKLEKTSTVMKLSSGFTGKEFKKIKDKLHAKEYIVQWDIKRIHGGAQGSRAPGRIEFGKTQVIEDILKRLNMWDAYQKLPMAKRMDRIHKIFGPMEEFNTKPRVKIGTETDYNLEGLIFADEEWMEANGIPFGAKTTLATKGLLVPIKLKDYDILIPSNENKWNLTEEQLSSTIRWRPDQSPEYAFSRNLRRWPTARFDMLSILDIRPGRDFDIDIDDIKRIYETGEITPDEMYSLFSYKNKDNETILRNEGIKIYLGESIHHENIWREAEKSLMNKLLSELHPKYAGFYGIAMPMCLFPKGKKKKKVWLTRYPWSQYIKTEVGVYKNCIFVDEELMNCFGGDFDRDQVACIYDNGKIDNGLDWTKNKEYIKSLFELPEKADEPANENVNEYDTIEYQLGQLSGCGIAYNNSKIVLDIARSAGYSKERIRDIDINLTSKVVQSFIDGFKYKGASNVPSVQDMIKTINLKTKGVDVQKHIDMFRVWRSRSTSLDDIVLASNMISSDGPDSFYEYLISMFKDWKRPGLKKNETVLDIDKKVLGTQKTYRRDYESQLKRLSSIVGNNPTKKNLLDVLHSCYKYSDKSLEICIMKKVKEEINGSDE